jgi:hypothetical protein
MRKARPEGLDSFYKLSEPGTGRAEPMPTLWFSMALEPYCLGLNPGSATYQCNDWAKYLNFLSSLPNPQNSYSSISWNNGEDE